MPSPSGAEHGRGMAAWRGFTLLEIMLVLLIMALISALAIPHLFQGPSSHLRDEARHLRQVLQLAAEEAQLRGLPLRWVAYPDHYRFELPDEDGKWVAMKERPFQPYAFPDGVRISEVRMQSNVLPASSASSADAEDAALGRVTMFPDGLMTVADVMLAGTERQVRLRLRPGPGGIALAEDNQ